MSVHPNQIENLTIIDDNDNEKLMKMNRDRIYRKPKYDTRDADNAKTRDASEAARTTEST